jgi:hypothetical protein
LFAAKFMFGGLAGKIHLHNYEIISVDKNERTANLELLK